MKVDVIVTFYRKHAEWPFVAWGLSKDLDSINHIYIVNDERWDDPSRKAVLAEAVRYALPCTLLDHDHDGFGAHVCANQGMDACQTDFVVHIDGDIVLSPGSIEESLELASEGTLVSPPLGDLPEADKLCWTNDPDNNAPILDVLRNDWRIGAAMQHPGMVIRNGYLVIHRSSHYVIDGYDLGYKGYGLIDYDYAVRWAIAHGDDNVVFGGGPAYHIGGVDDEEDRKAKQISEESKARFLRAIDLWKSKRRSALEAERASE